MSFCDTKGCIVECKNECEKYSECICDEKILKKMENGTKYCSVFSSKDGILVFCDKHRTAAGYLYMSVKILEYLYTNATLLCVSYSYLELIIRLRLLFQHIFAHKRTRKSSSGHLHRIKRLRVIAKRLNGLKRPLNAYPLGDAAHQEKVQKILNLGYVNIMHTVYNMINIQEDIKMRTTNIQLPRISAWNKPLHIN